MPGDTDRGRPLRPPRDSRAGALVLGADAPLARPDGTMFRTISTNLGTAKPLSSVEAVELRRRYTQIFLAAGMLISGAANTLTCKQAFLTVSSGHVFNHPFVQAGAMFLGEVGCLVFYLSRMRWRGKRVRWPPRHVLLGFALPALPHGQGRPSMQRRSLGTWLEALALTCTRRPSGPPSSAWADRAPQCVATVEPLLVAVRHASPPARLLGTAGMV